jgi:YfiH family protein
MNEEKSIIRPKIFANDSNVYAGICTRQGEEEITEHRTNPSYQSEVLPSIISSNRERLLTESSASDQDLSIPIQCHTNIVRRADAPGQYEFCDALITNVVGIALTVSVADCVPILLYDPMQKSIGITHAGWKGTVGAISQHTVKKMKDEYQSKPENIIVYIGPSAGVCCYEVGEEIAIKFQDENVIRKSGKVFVDLRNENKYQLVQQGITKNNIEVSNYCTICETTLFHSYRRDGQKSGRMTALIRMNK